MDFNQAFEIVIDHEGGFTDDSQDRGNWTGGKVGHGKLNGTKYGVSAATFPNLDIRSLTLSDAKSIYKRGYWDELKCGDLPSAIRLDVFDLAVNSGTMTAAVLLQRTLGVRQDGVIGPVTLAAAYKINPHMLDKRLSAARILYLTSLKTFPRYGKGWLIRIANNLPEGLKMLYRFLDTIGNGSGEINAIGNYAAAAESFLITPPTDQTYEIARMLVHVKDTGSLDSDSYGNGIVLTNGIKVVATINGVETVLTSTHMVYTNSDWGMYCYDVLPSNYGLGNESLAVRWSFAKGGEPIKLNGNDGDKLEVILNDDFSGLLQHHFFVHGRIK